MTKQEVWEFLANLRVGTVVAWLMVLAAIITVVVVGIKKLFKLFRDYSVYKEGKEATEARLKTHDETLAQLVQSNDLQTKLLVQVARSNIIIICLNAIKAGYITDVQLKELTDLYEPYEQNKGNSYAQTLMERVKELPVLPVLSNQ